MLLPKILLLELLLLVFLVNLSKDVLASSVEFLEAGVVGAHVERVVTVDEASMSKEQWMSQCCTWPCRSHTILESEHFLILGLTSIYWHETEHYFSGLVSDKVSRLLIVSVGVFSHHNAFFSSWDRAWHIPQ